MSLYGSRFWAQMSCETDKSIRRTYGANNGLLQEPSKERPLKVPKIHGLQRLSQDQAKSSRVGTNTVDALEFYPSSREISDAYDDDPQFPGISPLQIVDKLATMI